MIVVTDLRLIHSLRDFTHAQIYVRLLKQGHKQFRWTTWFTVVAQPYNLQIEWLGFTLTKHKQKNEKYIKLKMI